MSPNGTLRVVAPPPLIFATGLLAGFLLDWLVPLAGGTPLLGAPA